MGPPLSSIWATLISWHRHDNSAKKVRKQVPFFKEVIATLNARKVAESKGLETLEA